MACRELEIVDLQSRIARRETASSLAARVELSLSGALAVPAAPDMCGAHVRQTVQVLGETFNLQHGYAAPSARLASALDIMNSFSDLLVAYDDMHETSLRASLVASGIFECLLPVHNEGPAVAAPALPPSLIALPPNVPAVQMCRSRTDKASSRAAQSTLDKARALAAAELLKRIEALDAKSEKEKWRLQAFGDRTKAQLAKEQALRVARDELADAAAITHARDRNISAATDAALQFELLAARGRESVLAGKLASLEAQLQRAAGAGFVAAAEEKAEESSLPIEDVDAATVPDEESTDDCRLGVDPAEGTPETEDSSSAEGSSMATKEGAAVADAEDAYDDAFIIEDEEACDAFDADTVPDDAYADDCHLGLDPAEESPDTEISSAADRPSALNKEGAAISDAEDAFDDAFIIEDDEACEGAGVATVTNGERDNVRYLGPDRDGALDVNYYRGFAEAYDKLTTATSHDEFVSASAVLSTYGTNVPLQLYNRWKVDGRDRALEDRA